MYLTVSTKGGSQRLVKLSEVRSLTFEIDARSGPLCLIHTAKHERLLVVGSAEDIFKAFALNHRQLTFAGDSLT